jgi:hypothetical protein
MDNRWETTKSYNIISHQSNFILSCILYCIMQIYHTILSKIDEIIEFLVAIVDSYQM